MSFMSWEAMMSKPENVAERGLLDTAGMSRRLGIRPECLRRLIQQGCPCLRLGVGPRARYRFDTVAVRAWLLQCANRPLAAGHHQQEPPPVYESKYL